MFKSFRIFVKILKTFVPRVNLKQRMIFVRYLALNNKDNTFLELDVRMLFCNSPIFRHWNKTKKNDCTPEGFFQGEFWIVKILEKSRLTDSHS